jgi:hypothetical protein
MMKRTTHPGAAAALLLAASLCAFTPNLLAQDRDNAPQQGQQQDSQSKTYKGKIMKLQNGQFALITGQTPQGQASGHFLDKQDDAKKYEGKQVTVTGTLDVASNTIHVTKIEEAA